MAKKDPKAVVDDVVNHLAVKSALVEYTRKEVPVPGQTGGGTVIVEYVSSDAQNPFELAVVSTPNDETMAKVRFPLTRELSDDQIESISHDVLKLANGVEGNVSVGGGNRIVLSYTVTKKGGDNLDDATRSINETIAKGTSYGQGLRNILDKSFGVPTDPGAEKWYQYKLGQPVKLSPAEMNELQGGGIWDGLGTVLATGIGAYFGVVGGVVVGLVAYAEEVAITHPETVVPVVNPPTAPSGPSGPYRPYKTYCFASGTLVTTARGEVAMSAVVAGDVVSYRDVDGSEQSATVLGLDRHVGRFDMVEVVTAAGSIVATVDHPFFHNGEWVRADQLSGGSVLAVRPAPVATEVYNVRTATGVYAVGGLLVSGVTAAVRVAA